MFFVLSAGRSGSQTIAAALDGYGNCVCRHHPPPELVMECTKYFYGEYPADRIAEVLRDTRPAHKGIVYGEANLQLSLIVPVLEQVFPCAKYVWLYRDGRDSVASMYDRGWYDVTTPTAGPLWHAARLQGDRTGDLTSLEWEAMDRFDRCCWLWRKYNIVIESQMSRLAQDRWIAVRLDRLQEAFPRLVEFLELRGGRGKAMVEKLNVAKQPVCYWEQWDDERRCRFVRHCGAAMDRWFPEWRGEDGSWRRIEYETPNRAGAVLRAKRWLSSRIQLSRRRFQRLRMRLRGCSSGKVRTEPKC